jgi:DNA-binding NarL/FixJ family response regulator
MASALEEVGLEVIGPAASWDEAIAMATAEQPEAVLADLWMPTYQPERLGELCAALPECMIFVLSVLPVDQAREQIAGVGKVAAVYSKPEPPQEIASRIRDALEEAASVRRG